MNRELATRIIALLRFSGDAGAGMPALTRFGRADWSRTLDWLDVSGLSLYFLDRVTDSDAWGSLPAPVRDRLLTHLSENRRRVAGMADEFFGLTRLFRSEGIKHAALKGFTKVPDYCPDARLRTQFDHDFLVEPESLQHADRALRTAGYVLKPSHEIHPRAYIPADTPAWPHGGGGSFYSAGLARSVEIHIRLWDSESEGIPFQLPHDSLERARSATWEGQTFPALCEVDTLLFEVLHALRHLLGNWCRLSVLYEMACFLRRRRADAELWRRFGERMGDDPRLPQAAGVVFALAERVFHCDISDAARALTIAALTPPQRLWVERYGLNLAIDNFRKTKFALFLRSEFTDGSARLARQRWAPAWRRVRNVLGSAARSLVSSPHGLRQTAYALGRVSHHLRASLGYALERSRWRRLRAKSLACGEMNAPAGSVSV